MRVSGHKRPPVNARQFDVIVIGGGINGVAIARECALGGRRTLLLEQNDFGSGTSSRSTRIIHGGLRYLEHGELGLVKESLKERERLLQQRPHLVRPINFILALPKESLFSPRSAMAVRSGLWLYQRMSGGGSRCSSPAQEVAAFERSLDSGTGWSVFNYEDAQCEFPERMIAEWLTEAIAAGAVVRNHMQALAIKRCQGRVTGVSTLDALTGEESEYNSSCIINASGPWADRVCQDSEIAVRKMVGGVRGSHLLLPKFSGAPHSAVYTEAPDHRAFFVLPWNGQTLVGSTEVPDDGDPSLAQSSPAEVQYLFAAFQRIFPNSGLQFGDVKCWLAGIRPLPYAPGKNVSSVTRKHFLHEHSDDGAAGLISVIGGKLTTATAIARECARKIGVTTPEPASFMIARGPSNGFQNTLGQWSRQVAARCGSLSHESAMAIAEWHGRNALEIVRLASSQPQLRERLCPHTDHVVAEALYAIRNECAVSLGDILLRRVPVALGACWSEECGRQAATRIGAALGWESRHMEAALEDFEVERDWFMQTSQRARSNDGANVQTI